VRLIYTTTFLSLAILASFPSTVPSMAQAQSGPIATVNGKPISEADMKLAEAEIGPDIASLPDATKRRVLVEYLIENQIFSDAAETDKMASGEAFEARISYWRRRALRDMYFDKAVKGGVGEVDAKKFYDDQVKLIKPEDEVNARHILVEKKELALELVEKLKKGGDFAALAKENSKDPGSKEQGGDLGFFGKGQMVPAFEEAAFKLAKDQVSEPVETQFGWHVIKLIEKRARPVPTFDAVKDRIVGTLTQQKAQQLGADLRAKAKIDYIDADIKKQVDAEKTAAAAPAVSAPPAAAPPAAATPAAPAAAPMADPKKK
jgi:peptidyl-prolyl cis-trans isomerase C